MPIFAKSVILLSFFLHPLLHAQEENVLISADRFYEATLYNKAIPLYQEALSYPTTQEDKNNISLKLARSLYAENNYPQALEVVQKIPEEALNSDCLILLGLIHKNLGEHSESIPYFQKALLWPECEKEEAHLELGIAYFSANDEKTSRIYLERIQRSSLEKLPFYIAQIYLARLDLNQNLPDQALIRLDNLLKVELPSEPLAFEIAYWKGRAFFQMGDFQKASDFFLKALPLRNKEKASWRGDTLYYLGKSYLKRASLEADISLYAKAEDALRELYEIKSDERGEISLAELYLILGKETNNLTEFSKGWDLLKNSSAISLTSQAHKLYLKSFYALDPKEKNDYLRELAQERYAFSPYYSKGWFLQGALALEEGRKNSSPEKKLEGLRSFQEAAIAFEKSIPSLKNTDQELAALALKLKAEALWFIGSQDSHQKALEILQQFFHDEKELLKKLREPDEVFYLTGLTAVHLSKKDPQDPLFEYAEKTLNKAIQGYPKGNFKEKNLFLLGTLDYYKKNYSAAAKNFLQIIEENPASSLAPDLYFWTAKSLEMDQPDNENILHYRKKIYTDYPNSPYAAEAYFFSYPYKEYLQGSRPVMKHLQGFIVKFPHTPFLINAHYLLGMDLKRDRRTAEGKWIRKKDLNSAIDAFQEAESTFDYLYSHGKIPEDELSYFIKLRYRSTLERALTNLAVADESQGAKKKIFLEYAEDVFQQIMQDFKSPAHPLTSLITQREPFYSLLEESSFWLAQTYLKLEQDEKAKGILNEMLERYQNAKISRGYFLSRVWYELGQIERRLQNPKQALQDFARAEDAAKGKVLNNDQKIDLWIQQSLCYKDLEDTDKSMLILSKAINNDEVSSLRVKAMFLRAELYAKQGRHELARKQLEATSKKGGIWAQKAKQKLEQDYGYQ